MRTSPDCLPCFLRQIAHAARLATADPDRQKLILERAAALLPAFDLSRSPPENSVALYRLVAELADCPDPFANLKQSSNAAMHALRPRLLQSIRAAADPLLAAMKFAAAGNIIDYGSQQDFDLEQTLAACLARDFAIDDATKLSAAIDRLGPADTVLYLGDNCGELVMDGILIEMLAGRGLRVVLALKEYPIINDATVVDAQKLGLDRFCAVISNGTGCPGTPLASCSTLFQREFRRASLIISKGQGNFQH